MAFTVTLTNFMGAPRVVEVFHDMLIYEFKNYLDCIYYSEVAIFKNMKEIISGTIESNNIKPNDVLNIVCKLKTGFDIRTKNELNYIIKKYNDIQNNIQDDIQNDIIYVVQEEPKTPLELFGRIQQQREITSDDYDKEDMRILFQQCRDQIEDEPNKMKQLQKEHDRTKHKFAELRKKMNLKKKKNIKDNRNNRNNTDKTVEIPIKKTFCGFKKGFLLK